MSQRRQPDIPSGRLVDSADEFADVCQSLQHVDRFGFDAEFVAEDAYSAEACLIQVATEQDIWLIDPLAGFDVKPFWELVGDKRIEKIVHAGMEDLSISFNETGNVPLNIFDVQIAAGFVGYDYPMSLLRLSRSIVGARLHKSQTLTDWRRRPLTGEQIRYAVHDVAHLIAMRDRIAARLADRKRTNWAAEEFARFSDRGTYRAERRELFWKVKGVGSLDRQGLAVMRELAAERNDLAAKLDRPPRVVLRDHLMVAIARHGMTDPEKLKTLRGIGLRAGALDRIASAVRRGLATAPDDCPEAPKVDDDTIQESTLRKLVSAVLTDYCHAEDIAVQLLATNKDIRALILTHTRGETHLGPGGLQRGWRKKEIGDLVEDVLTGQRSVRVTKDSTGPRLSIE